MELIGDYSIEMILDGGQIKRIIFYNLKREWLIDYDQEGLTRICFDRMWLIFGSEYNMEYNDIQRFMKTMLLKCFKIKNAKPWTLVLYKMPELFS